MKRVFHIVIIVATLAALTIGSAVAPVSASVVIPVDLPELAASATAIARGHIVRVEARQTGSLRVERLITFAPAEYLKGNLGAVVQFRLPGGTFGRYRTISVGAPEFKEGDEVVLFLGVTDSPLPVILGFHQGVYRIVLSASTGERMVTPPLLQDITSSAAGQPAVPIVRGDTSRRALPWTQFQARVNAALASPVAAAAPAAAAAAAGAAPARAVRRVQ
jgi:hypothetical protein